MCNSCKIKVDHKEIIWINNSKLCSLSVSILIEKWFWRNYAILLHLAENRVRSRSGIVGANDALLVGNIESTLSLRCLEDVQLSLHIFLSILPCLASPWWKFTLITGGSTGSHEREDKFYLSVVASLGPRHWGGGWFMACRSGRCLQWNQRAAARDLWIGSPLLQSPPHLFLIDFVSAHSHNH